MYSTPPKRAASNSPDDRRPNKRHAPSSPEEGEVDDSPPLPPPRQTTPPPKAKVPFPFKRKVSTRDDEREPYANGDGYDRGRDDDRHRYEDRRWTVAEPMRHETRPAPSRATDRWGLSAGRYDRWGRPERDYHDSHYSERERDRSRERTRCDLPQRPMSRNNSPRISSPRRLPSSPLRSHTRSAARSRSASTPRSLSPPSTRKPTHRLPIPRDSDTSNALVGYYRERGDGFSPRSNSRSRGRSGSRDRRRTDREDSYGRRSRHDGPRDEYRRRPEAHNFVSPNGYRPVSPGAVDASRPRSPHTPPRSDARRSSPARVELSQKGEILPSSHPTIKFTLQGKKAPTPLRLHSPPSLLVAAKTDVVKPKPFESKVEEGQVEEKKLPLPPPPPHRTKRKPVVRSREEEAAVYGRVFVGCGRQGDYNVLTKLGEGTFGEVHKAVHCERGNTVALKRILMHNEKEGMPVTALREIKILKSLHHPNIIDIEDMFIVKSNGKEPLSVFMVFPYMDHDLAGLLENERVQLSPSQIKLYMKQLIEGTEYMHRNHILHRDMKAANLLISNDGCLKIADFGLARAFDPRITQVKEDVRGKERKYTNCVVTRWYRPPELLLGARQYGGEVDMWGIGCVLGEMFTHRPILPGASDLDQLEKIWQLCGTPNERTWPGWDLLPGCEGVRSWNAYNRQIRFRFDQYHQMDRETLDLLEKLLTCNPKERLTAEQALDHDYFWSDPVPADPTSLPKYEASHEFDKRGRRHDNPPPHFVTVGHGGRQYLPPNGPPNFHHGNGGHPPMHRRPPPPREHFRTGPMNHGLPHLPPPPGFPNSSQRFYAPPVPTTLPPITLRPGQPPPGIGQWVPPGGSLPPPPSVPRHPPSQLRHEYSRGPPLNYG
ncbi:Pkinase-domain-containing protein [Fomitopsis betulina]|nr:Pkinase-domain-containing protein [Fomitopsis betulina]